MWYGSDVSRQGRARPFRSYQPRSRRRKLRRDDVDGSARLLPAEALACPGLPADALAKAGLRILAAMKIYTRTGDAGGTALFGGTRVSKADPRVAAYGDVDELNACLGTVSAQSELAGDIADLLEQLQKDLFAIGARLADPATKIAERVAKVAVTDADIRRLEDWIDRLEAELPPLRRFILPGGNRAGALLHFSRTVCRRAERSIVALGADEVDTLVLAYVNRLSDLLFVMARAVNHRAGQPEVEW
jgi:cob(I)alamin adenosyltransferase